MTGARVLPYWLIFAVWTIAAVQAERRSTRSWLFPLFITASIFTALFIGLRFEVGGDWGAYLKMYDSIYFLSLSESINITDPGYAAVNWLSAQGDLGIIFVNLVCAVLFVGGLARLAWKQPQPGLAMLVAIPYFAIVVAMGYTRQAAAIGLVCFVIADASEKRLVRLVFFIGIATLFHKTAVLLLPIALVPIFRKNIFWGGFGAVIFCILFVVLLRDKSDQLINNYVQGDYDSQGAFIRVMMNVIAAVIFLFLNKKVHMPDFQKSYWKTCSILALVSVPALAIASASAGIDRISLYLIPLQIVVYSRIPLMFGQNRALPSALIGIMLYCFLVQFVWLNYAENANYWVPYRSIISR